MHSRQIWTAFVNTIKTSPRMTPIVTKHAETASSNIAVMNLLFDPKLLILRAHNVSGMPLPAAYSSRNAATPFL